MAGALARGDDAARAGMVRAPVGGLLQNRGHGERRHLWCTLRAAPRRQTVRQRLAGRGLRCTVWRGGRRGARLSGRRSARARLRVALASLRNPHLGMALRQAAGPIDSRSGGVRSWPQAPRRGRARPPQASGPFRARRTLGEDADDPTATRRKCRRRGGGRLAPCEEVAVRSVQGGALLASGQGTWRRLVPETGPAARHVAADQSDRGVQPRGPSAGAVPGRRVAGVIPAGAKRAAQHR